MKFSRLIQCSLFALMACTCLQSCSKTEIQQPVSSHHAMPDNYSTQAIDAFNELAAFLPENTSAAAFASYGSLVETLNTVNTWHLFDDERFKSTIHDLELHYKLNPTKLKSFYKAGFHTQKGFSVGVVDGNLVLALNVMDQNAFIKWFDNFTNEEFGRPSTKTSDDKGWKFREITVMNEDYATLALAHDIALIAFGKKFARNPSHVIAQQLVAAHTDGRNLLNQTYSAKLIQQIGKAPIAAMMLSDSWLPNAIPANIRSAVMTAVNTAAVAITTETTRASLTVSAHVKQNNNYIKSIQKIGTGEVSQWAYPLIHASQPSAARVLFDPVGLENVMLENATSSQVNQWNDIKSKLNQRLMNINFYEQVFKNLAGSAWILPANVTDLTRDSLNYPQFLDTDIAIFLPIKDVNKAANFFGKLNLLKSLIPSSYAQIETIHGILHAVVKLNGKQLHVAYADGLISASTNAAWERTLAIYNSPNTAEINHNILTSNDQIALDINANDALALLNNLCAPKYQKSAGFVQRLNHLQTSAALKDNWATLKMSADVINP